MGIKTIIIDDEQLARELLENYIYRTSELELIASFKSPVEAINCLKKENIDLIFLDIQMPDLTGIEFIKMFRPKANIIFTTAYSEYAVDGYALDIIDYLLKPFTFERFIQAVERISRLRTIPDHWKEKRDSKNYILINSEHQTYKILYSDIDYIEGLREYVSFYVNGRRIISLQSLKHLEEVLPKDEFLRVHRSYIVPLNKVDVFRGNQLNIKDKPIPIGRSYKNTVMASLFQ